MDRDISEKIERISKRIIGKYPLKYNPEIHIPMLIDQFMQGRGISAFCYGAEICEKTFNNWVNTHKDFSEAYSIAKQMSKLWWEQKANDHLVNFTGETFNTTLWSIIMRNKFNYTEHRKIEIPELKKAKTLKAQIKCIMDYVSDNKLTANEANQVSNLVLACMKVDENMELRKKVEELEAMVAK